MPTKNSRLKQENLLKKRNTKFVLSVERDDTL